MRIRTADITDIEQIFRVVNEAYCVEKGDTGLAFKREDRYLDVKEVVRDLLIQKNVYFYVESDIKPFYCYGVMAVKVIDDDITKKCRFGPLAVHPTYQGRGIGGKLLESGYSWCHANAIGTVEIEVVNHRTDLFVPPDGGYYGKKGYRKIGTRPFGSLNDCGEEACSRPSHFVILEKSLTEN